MNAMASSYQQYKKHDVMMANPLELIVMLYNGCVKQLKLAEISIDKKDYEAANTQLQKAQDIVMELVNGLDFSYSIATELMALYDFISREIISINATKNAEAIQPLTEILLGLRDTWEQVLKSNRGNAYQMYEGEM